MRVGYEMIVSMGGDGTNNEVINGFFENGAPIRPDAVLAVLPMGTGGDFVKTIGIPKVLDEALPFLAGTATTPCDAGHLTYFRHDGAPAEMYFLNIADFGMGGEIVHRVNNTTKLLRGFLSFLWGTVRTAASYKDKHVRLVVDGKDIGEHIIRNVVIANGRYFGGGMHIAPEAEIDDGLFDILILRKTTVAQGVKVLRMIYSGEILNCKEFVEFHRGRRLDADSSETVLLDVDGEQPGRIPSSFTIIPKPIRLKVKPQA